MKKTKRAKNHAAVALGRLGGKVTSDRKKVAILKNLEKARKNRWKNVTK